MAFGFFDQRVRVRVVAATGAAEQDPLDAFLLGACDGQEAFSATGLLATTGWWPPLSLAGTTP